MASRSSIELDVDWTRSSSPDCVLDTTCKCVNSTHRCLHCERWVEAHVEEWRSCGCSVWLLRFDVVDSTGGATGAVEVRTLGSPARTGSPALATIIPVRGHGYREETLKTIVFSCV
jgi:hypothetical protein